MIRTLREDDLGSYVKIRMEMLRDDPASFGEDYEQARKRSPESYLPQIAGFPDAGVFGYFADGQLRGTAGVFRQRGLKMRHKAVLWGVYVQPGARGAGVGEKLVMQVIAHAAQDCTILQTTVVSSNAAAVMLYERLGFVAYGLERMALKVGADYHDESLLALDLTSTGASPVYPT